MLLSHMGRPSSCSKSLVSMLQDEGLWYMSLLGHEIQNVETFEGILSSLGISTLNALLVMCDVMLGTNDMYTYFSR